MRLLPLLAASLAALLAAAPAPAEAASNGVGLSVGPGVGGGSLVSGVAQLQLSRAFFLEGSLGYRGGWDIGEQYYPNLALGFGTSATFGKRPWRNGFFVNLASTLPAGFHEAWIAAGWSARIWGPEDVRSFTLDLGLAAYLVRTLPPGTDLDQIPGFVHARVTWHFPLIERAGNESERPPRRERGRKRKDEAGDPVDTVEARAPSASAAG